MALDSKAHSTAPSNTEVDENTIDVALMMRAKDGDMKAFEQLVIRHQDAVVGTVAKMLNNSSDAEDIAQQVFVRIWKSAPRYQVKAKFTTYLYTVTRNLVFNESKRRSRKKAVSIEERAEESHLEVRGDENHQPDNSVLHSELQTAVDNAINELPETQRMAIILRRYEQLNYEDIAKTLEISVSAVKSQLFRARTSLKSLLEGYLNS